MLIPTNGSFFAVNGFALPVHRGASASLSSVVYDAGSEPNDKLCASIPGADVRRQGTSINVNGECFVHMSSGIHGQGDLTPAQYDWRNPVARITITRVP